MIFPAMSGNSLDTTRYSDTLITKAWKKLGGYLINVAHDEIHAVFYDASWDGGANPYRAVVLSRPGDQVTDIYESSDGLDWTLKNSDILNPVSTTYRTVKSVVYDSSNTRYIMGWLSSVSGGTNDEEIAIATSSDLITWANTGVVLAPGDGTVPADVNAVYASGMAINGSTLYMMVDEEMSSDADYRITLYSCPLSDLTDWTRGSIKIQSDTGTAWKYSEVFQGHLQYSDLDSIWVYYYTGIDASGIRKIGVATSATVDGTYTDWTQNPSIGDGSLVGEPFIFDDTSQSGEWRLYYRYHDGTYWWSKVARFTEI